MSTSSAQPLPSSKKQKKPLFADYPTIKILTPPQGRFSPKTDEWCFTYCSQSINGRIHRKEPYCRSICIRKVFPHEVRNVLSFKHHKSVGPDGKAKYPLPPEGQSESVPRLLGGKLADDSDEELQHRKTGDTKYWDEGLYMWTGKGRWAVQEKTETMLLDLEQQQRLQAFREKAQEAQRVAAGESKQAESVQLDKPQRKKWGYVVPQRPATDTKLESLLVPLPPDFPPFWDRINKLLAPTFRVMEIFRGSIASGEQTKFALRVWEKAWTDEPFVLASRTFTRAYERWKENEDDGKDSP